MGAGELGYLVGTFLVTGVLASALLAHGRSKNKSWALVLGLVIGLGSAAAAVKNGNLNAGHVAGLVACALAWVLTRKKAP